MPALVIHFDVTYADDRAEGVDVYPSDLIAWERHFNLGSGNLDLTRIEHRFWLVWSSLSRQGKTELAFEEWADTIARVTSGEAQDVPPLEETTTSTG